MTDKEFYQAVVLAMIAAGYTAVTAESAAESAVKASRSF